MRVLILTQIVDSEDTVLGFFHSWIEAFAKKATSIEVICLKEGEHSLPASVRVHSLGKEKGVTRLGRVVRFYRYIFSLRREYDAVLVHMNPEYVVLGGLFWRLMGKSIGLWYTHKSVTIWLRIATWFTHYIFTASAESFRLGSKKVLVTGHGISTTVFSETLPTLHVPLRLITVGRISRIKHYELMVQLLSILGEHGVLSSLTIVGEPITSDDVRYTEELKKMVLDKKLSVTFAGGLPHREVASALKNADVFINCSETGSLDKAILEAWAVGLYVVTTNEGIRSAATFVDRALPYASDAQVLVRAIMDWRKSGDEVRAAYRRRAHVYVLQAHSLEHIVSTIVATLTGSKRG